MDMNWGMVGIGGEGLEGSGMVKKIGEQLGNDWG